MPTVPKPPEPLKPPEHWRGLLFTADDVRALQSGRLMPLAHDFDPNHVAWLFNKGFSEGLAWQNTLAKRGPLASEPHWRHTQSWLNEVSASARRMIELLGYDPKQFVDEGMRETMPGIANWFQAVAPGMEHCWQATKLPDHHMDAVLASYPDGADARMLGGTPGFQRHATRYLLEHLPLALRAFVVSAEAAARLEPALPLPEQRRGAPTDHFSVVLFHELTFAHRATFGRDPVRIERNDLTDDRDTSSARWAQAVLKSAAERAESVIPDADDVALVKNVATLAVATVSNRLADGYRKAQETCHT